MIVTGTPEHSPLVQHEQRRRAIWYCIHADWIAQELDNGIDLNQHYEIHYRSKCPRCFIGFMQNARTKNRFTVGGETKAAYDLGEARRWFFGAYKGAQE